MPPENYWFDPDDDDLKDYAPSPPVFGPIGRAFAKMMLAIMAVFLMFTLWALFTGWLIP